MQGLTGKTAASSNKRPALIVTRATVPTERTSAARAKVNPNSLYERMGGKPAVEKAVDIFYQRIVKDESLQQFFEGISIPKLKAKQFMFMSFAFGAAGEQFSGSYLSKSHAHLARDKGMNLEHFDMVAGHFVATLQQLNLPKDLLEEAVGIVSATRPLFTPEYMEGDDAKADDYLKQALGA